MTDTHLIFHRYTAEIAKSFWTNEELGGKLRLDAVICVVDGKNVEKVSKTSDSELCGGKGIDRVEVWVCGYFSNCFLEMT